MAASTPSIPSTHAAWTFTRPGDPSDVLSLTTDYPTPSPQSLKAGEALIKVSAVSLNAGALLFITAMPHPTSHRWIPELEFAGVIVALGPPGNNEEALQVGDEVMGARDLPTMLKQNGAMQSYLVNPIRLLTRKPKNMSMIDASGLTGVGCTAIQSLEVAGVKRGDKVLVTGGSGGLGSMLVQMAKAIVGETGVVVATCSGKNEELVKGLGADEVIDYNVHDPLHVYLQEHHSSAPFNAIFDVVGSPNQTFTSSPAYLARTGTFVLLGAMGVVTSQSVLSLIWFVLMAQLNRFRPTILGGTPRRYLFYSATPNSKDMKRTAEMVEAGKIKSLLDSVWKMADAKKAFERMMTQRARGKIVVDFE